MRSGHEGGVDTDLFMMVFDEGGQSRCLRLSAREGNSKYVSMESMHEV